MVYSLLSRLLLLSLLPVIALTLYMEGQEYNPALIRFTSSQMSVGREASFLPRELDGYIRSGQLRHFAKANLHEYINGHAEYFISAGFIGLTVGEYVRPGSEQAQPDLVVDIYDMGKDLHAFGVFADEIGDRSATLQIGMMAAETLQGISFITGKYYVRIASYEGNQPVHKLAERINELIGASRESFTLFDRLPALEEVVATRYIKEDYRGLHFVRNVVEREYDLDGKMIQLSLAVGSKEEMKQLVSSYLEFFRESDIPYERADREGRKLYRVMDPYEGVWYLLPSHDALFGMYGDIDEGVLESMLSGIARGDQEMTE